MAYHSDGSRGAKFRLVVGLVFLAAGTIFSVCTLAFAIKDGTISIPLRGRQLAVAATDNPIVFAVIFTGWLIVGLFFGICTWAAALRLRPLN